MTERWERVWAFHELEYDLDYDLHFGRLEIQLYIPEVPDRQLYVNQILLSKEDYDEVVGDPAMFRFIYNELVTEMTDRVIPSEIAKYYERDRMRIMDIERGH